MIERLTTKQREALRLRAANYRTKQIAAAMGGISENTIHTYLSSATNLLGAPGREAAARQLIAWEAEHPEARGRFSVGDAEAPAIVITVAADKPEPRIAPRSRLLPPLRSMRGPPSELGPGGRLLWLVLLATLLAIGFGQLMIAAGVINGLWPRIQSPAMPERH